MNQSLVTSLGFSTPTTYADIVAMVDAAASEGFDVITLNGADSWAWGSCLMSGIIDRLSGDPHWVSKAVAGEFSFTDQVFIDSLSFITQMVSDGVLSADVTSIDYAANLSNFNNEQALFNVYLSHSASTGCVYHSSLIGIGRCNFTIKDYPIAASRRNQTAGANWIRNII